MQDVIYYLLTNHCLGLINVIILIITAVAGYTKGKKTSITLAGMVLSAMGAISCMTGVNYHSIDAWMAFMGYVVIMNLYSLLWYNQAHSK